MAADVDIFGLGLLDGLDGEARTDRAELIDWLLKRGFNIDQIHGSVASPLLLPMNRVLGDDGTLVSAPENADTVTEARGAILRGGCS